MSACPGDTEHILQCMCWWPEIHGRYLPYCGSSTRHEASGPPDWPPSFHCTAARSVHVESEGRVGVRTDVMLVCTRVGVKIDFDVY